MIRPRKAQPELEMEARPHRRKPVATGRVRMFLIGLIVLFVSVVVVMLMPGFGRSFGPSFGQDDERLVLLPTVTPTPASLALLVAAAQQEAGVTHDGLPARAGDAPAPSLGMAAPLPTATPFPTPTPQPFSATVNVLANLRVGPGTNYSVVRYAEPGAVVAVVGASADGEWYRLDDELWIAAALVDKLPPLR